MAWESRDAAKVAKLYASDATHASGKVRELRPELGRSELHGVGEIEQYARAAFSRFKQLRFELQDISMEGNSASIEYLRYSDVDGVQPQPVLEESGTAPV